MSKRTIAAAMFGLSRHRRLGPVVRWTFARLWPLLPVRRVASTQGVLAFHHPRPAWPTHLLLVPKTGLASLLALAPAHLPILRDLLRLARQLRAGLDLPAGASGVLIINGGAYQEVGQLHAHLVAGPTAPAVACPVAPPVAPLLVAPGMIVSSHPQPTRQTHLVLQASAPLLSGSDDPAEHERLWTVIDTIQTLVRQRGLERAGYSLMLGAHEAGLDLSCVHLVAGPRVNDGRPSPPPAPQLDATSETGRT